MAAIPQKAGQVIFAANFFGVHIGHISKDRKHKNFIFIE